MEDKIKETAKLIKNVLDLSLRSKKELVVLLQEVIKQEELEKEE